MTEDRLFILIGKKVAGELTITESEELAHLLSQRSVGSHSLELLEEVWKKKAADTKEDVSQKWSALAARLEVVPALKAKPRTKIKTIALLAAASVALLVFFYFKTDQIENAPKIEIAKKETVLMKDSVIVAENGQRKKVLLPDGSRVQLNSGSELRFGSSFGMTDRDVSLTGEAFFEVTRNEALPFFVNTTRMVVRVVGTSFNVKAYNTQEDIETTVMEGKVEISLKGDSEKKVVLQPKEKISINNKFFNDTSRQQLKYEVEAVKQNKEAQEILPQEFAWLNEKIVFAEEPFETVALKMERWYNVRIHFNNEKVKGILMSGDFYDVDISQAFQILQMMVDFKYDIEGRDIYVDINN